MGTSRTIGGLRGPGIVDTVTVACNWGCAAASGDGPGGGDCKRVNWGGDWARDTNVGLITQDVGVCGGGEKGLSSIVIRGLIDRLKPGRKRAGEERAEDGDIGISTTGLGDRLGTKSFWPIDLKIPGRTVQGALLAPFPLFEFCDILFFSFFCNVLHWGKFL